MTELFLEALMFFIAALMGIFALFIFAECQHMKAERRKRQQVERWVNERCQLTNRPVQGDAGFSTPSEGVYA